VSFPSLDQDLGRYLRLLDFRSPPSGLDGLRELVLRHLCRVPFENISKLALAGREGAGRFVTLPEFLDGIEHRDLGGTCHSNNPFLWTLLRALGYDADLLGGDMGPRQNVHTSIRVRIEGAAYHVDVGFGGPFREPIRLDRIPHEIVEGRNRYLLDRTSGGEYEMAVFAGEERLHGYIAHDTPRSRDFFVPGMQASFQPPAPFLNCVRICRFFGDYSITLLNRTINIHRGATTTSRELTSIEEWSSALANDLKMPRCPWEDALKFLEGNTGRPFVESPAAPMRF
jgi:arylamine N-acetyltransferase